MRPLWLAGRKVTCHNANLLITCRLRSSVLCRNQSNCCPIKPNAWAEYDVIWCNSP